MLVYKHGDISSLRNVSDDEALAMCLDGRSDGIIAFCKRDRLAFGRRLTDHVLSIGMRPDPAWLDEGDNED